MKHFKPNTLEGKRLDQEVKLRAWILFSSLSLTFSLYRTWVTWNLELGPLVYIHELGFNDKCKLYLLQSKSKKGIEIRMI
jgi:hypothetical protein